METIRSAAMLTIAVASALMAGCASGGSSIAPLRSTPGAPTASPSSAPASLAAISPAPGYPTPPPAGPFTVEASTGSSPSPVLQTLPLPPAIGNLSSGVSRAQAERIADLLPAEPTTAIVAGSIVSFGANSVEVALTAPIAPDPSASPYPTILAAGGLRIPKSLTLVLSPQTVDAVPGGFGSMRVGDAVLALSDLASASPVVYLTDLTLVAKYVLPLASATPSPSGATAPVRVASAPQARRSEAIPYRNSPFTLEGSSSPSTMYRSVQNLPLPFNLHLPFLGLYTTLDSVVVDVGTRVDYPLTLADVSTPSFVENQPSTLPISVLNLPNYQKPAFTAAAEVSLDVHVVGTLEVPNVSRKVFQFSASDDFGSLGTDAPRQLPGVGMESISTAGLPADNVSATLEHTRTLGATFDPLGLLLAVAVKEEPQLLQFIGKQSKFPVTAQFQLDGDIAGSTVDGQLTLSDGTPNIYSSISFDPGVIPGSSNVFTPLSPNGEVVPNDTVFRRAPGRLPYSGTVTLQTDLYLSTPAGPQPVDPVAIYSPGPFAFANAGFIPAKIELKLTPRATPAPSPTPSPAPTSSPVLSYLCVGIPKVGATYPSTGGDGCVLISHGTGQANTDYIASGPFGLCSPPLGTCGKTISAQYVLLAASGAPSPLQGVTVKGETSGAHSGAKVGPFQQIPWCDQVPGGDPSPLTITKSGSTFTVRLVGRVNPNGGGGSAACVMDIYDNFGDSVQLALDLAST